MIIHCPHCAKANRIPADKINCKPTCGSCKQELLSLPINTNVSNFNELVAQTLLPVIVDFWAPWCGPCRVFAPTFQASAIANANQVIFLKVDTEAEQILGAEWHIRSIPTLVTFKHGKEVERLSGALPPAQLAQLIQKLLLS